MRSLNVVLRSFIVACLATLAVWGVILTPWKTVTTAVHCCGMVSFCRLGGPDLTCAYETIGNISDDATAANAQEIPADYYLRLNSATKTGGMPYWDPYAGSGHPIYLDGHNSRLSPTRWLLRLIPGDRGRDLLIFSRILLWTWGLALALLLLGVSLPLVSVLSLAATIAPYLLVRIDHVMLDVDLLAPWSTVLLLAAGLRRISLRSAMIAGSLLGALVGSLGFLQSQFVFLTAVGVLAAISFPAFGFTSLAVLASIGMGFLAVYPAWLPLLQNLGEFVSSRSVEGNCQIGMGMMSEELLLDIGRLDRGGYHALGVIGGFSLIVSMAKKFPHRFLLVGLTIFTAWGYFAAPYFCSVPILKGIYFARHFSPYAQFFYLFCVGVAAEAVFRSGSKTPWPILLGMLLTFIALLRGEAPWNYFVPALFCLLFVSLALVLRFWRRDGKAREWSLALSVLVLVTSVFTSRPSYLKALFSSRLPPDLPALSSELNPNSPIGAVQKASLEEDRRHFSPSGILFPNASSIFRILDLRFLGALYPKSYYALNGGEGLFSYWSGDSSHRMNPDRFVRTEPESLAFGSDFQRVLITNRVSLFTFPKGGGSFSELAGPYEAKRCRVLSQSDLFESYVCPEVGGVGYFPTKLDVAETDEAAIRLLKSQPLSKLVGYTVLSREAKAASGKIVSFERYGDVLIYRLDVEEPGVFVVADTWFPGWHARVNGKATEILKANLAFKAVSVPKGKTEIEFSFKP